MKKKLCLIIIGIIIFSSFSFAASIENSMDVLTGDKIDEWGIVALNNADKEVEKYPLEEVSDSKILTDHEAYLLGALAKGLPVESTINLIKNSQMENGKFSDQINGIGDELINSHVWGVISLYAAGEEINDAKGAKNWLLNQQLDDGSFPIFVGDDNGSLDLTAMGLIALKCLDTEDNNPKVIKGFNYLENNIEYKESSESLSWLILARVFYNKLDNEKWIKKLSEYERDNGYAHLKMQSKGNYMGTWHSVLALTDNNNGYSFIENIRNNNSFKDINSETLYRESIIKLLNRNLLSGYPDKTFRPKNTITRGEISKVIVNGFNLSNKNKADKGFKDIENHWSKDFVMIAKSNGLINGVNKLEFKPNEPITGAEFATILVRGKGLSNSVNNSLNKNWYDGYVSIADENGLLYDNFDPLKPVTRAEVAASMIKIIN